MATSRKFVPPVAFHPGNTLSDKLEEMGMGVKEFAVRTSKPEKTIFAVISGKS
jgi:predicted transcriptional regulator